MSKVRILFIAADPLSDHQGTPRLLLDEEARQIRRKVRAAQHRDIIEFDVRWAARTSDLLEALTEIHPQVLHFSGHAQDEGLVLVSEEGGRPHPLHADRLVRLLRTFHADLRLVVLSACNSLSHAEALTAIVDCAIGIRTIPDKAAISFNAAFYGAVAAGHSVQAAYEQACAVLRLEQVKEEQIPVLVVQPGVDASRLVLIPGNGAGGGPPAPRLVASPTVFSVPTLPRDPDLVAVMMPSPSRFAGTYQQIRKTCDAAGLRCQRADTAWEESTVIQEVFSLIYRSAAVVADLSGPDPHVMYECGIAHTLGRPLIPISRDTRAPSFDVAHHRILPYQTGSRGYAAMRKALESRLRSVTGRTPE